MKSIIKVEIGEKTMNYPFEYRGRDSMKEISFLINS